jgi:hypothetical protein
MALQRLHEELKPFANDKEFGTRVGYWQGFALWRRAINGFNESADKDELEADLLNAIGDFELVLARNVTFTDAKIANGSCLLTLVFLHSKDESGRKKFLSRALAVLKEAEKEQPENPRLLWVLGASHWAWPLDGSGQAAAFETYHKGLEAVRKHKTDRSDPLMPSWGEPELLMNLAWSNLHLKTPDLLTAEKYARAALALVPYWHYVRDILIPQIDTAKSHQANSMVPSNFVLFNLNRKWSTPKNFIFSST